jgi:peptidoglycan/LPS O-acetylase OafA/YrhL
MTMRTRKLIGTVVLMLFLAAYALVAMLVAVALQVQASKMAELIYYIVAGLAWTVPAGAVIWWMQRPDPPSEDSAG